MIHSDSQKRFEAMPEVLPTPGDTAFIIIDMQYGLFRHFQQGGDPGPVQVEKIRNDVGFSPEMVIQVTGTDIDRICNLVGADRGLSRLVE